MMYALMKVLNNYNNGLKVTWIKEMKQFYL